MSSRGCFITFEGLEGAGKSTQVARLRDTLAKDGIEVVVTREPGGTALADRIRSILLDKDVQRSGISEALLFSLARFSHVRQCIRPALQSGKWVICDRFVDTTRAYQGAGRGVAPWIIEGLIKLTAGSVQPDLTIILDIPPESVGARLENRATVNRFDREQREFFERARAGYRSLAQQEPDRVQLIDATPDVDEVTARINALTRPLIEEHRCNEN